MIRKFTVYRLPFTASFWALFRGCFLSTVVNRQQSKGFTLIETLVAITLLTVAIVAPMSLTAKSLSAAYYARDQITAFYLAQEAIESLRSIRDGQILKVALGDPGVDIFGPIPSDQAFTIDARKSDAAAITICPGSPQVCPPLQTDANSTLYGYEAGWKTTNFTRTVRATAVRSDAGVVQEIRVIVTIKWKTGAFQVRTFEISTDLYRWIPDDTSG